MRCLAKERLQDEAVARRSASNWLQRPIADRYFLFQTPRCSFRFAAVRVLGGLLAARMVSVWNFVAVGVLLARNAFRALHAFCLVCT